MKSHLERKTQCKLSETGLDINVADYKEQILNRTFDKAKFIKQSQKKSAPKEKDKPKERETESNYCERCHKPFKVKFKDPEHTIVCNETLEEYKKIEEERDDLEDEVQKLRMLNMHLNNELVQFLGVTNKCVDDYKKSNGYNPGEKESDSDSNSDESDQSDA